MAVAACAAQMHFFLQKLLPCPRKVGVLLWMVFWLKLPPQNSNFIGLTYLGVCLLNIGQVFMGLGFFLVHPICTYVAINPDEIQKAEFVFMFHSFSH